MLYRAYQTLHGEGRFWGIVSSPAVSRLLFGCCIEPIEHAKSRHFLDAESSFKAVKAVFKMLYQAYRLAQLLFNYYYYYDCDPATACACLTDTTPATLTTAAQEAAGAPLAGTSLQRRSWTPPRLAPDGRAT
jgi:hypothetical protein